MKNGKVIEEDGTVLYYKNDLLHREDGPALVTQDKTQVWYKNGEVHSYDNQPAIVSVDGFKSWYDTGIRHRSDGPAVIHPDGKLSFYYFGYFAAEEEVFNLQAWRTEVEGLVSGINDAPDMSKYLNRDEETDEF